MHIIAFFLSLSDAFDNDCQAPLSRRILALVYDRFVVLR
jgi:hypothetical protein